MCAPNEYSNAVGGIPAIVPQYPNGKVMNYTKRKQAIQRFWETHYDLVEPGSHIAVEDRVTFEDALNHYTQVCPVGGIHNHRLGGFHKMSKKIGIRCSKKKQNRIYYVRRKGSAGGQGGGKERSGTSPQVVQQDLKMADASNTQIVKAEVKGEAKKPKEEGVSGGDDESDDSVVTARMTVKSFWDDNYELLKRNKHTPREVCTLLQDAYNHYNELYPPGTPGHAKNFHKWSNRLGIAHNATHAKPNYYFARRKDGTNNNSGQSNGGALKVTTTQKTVWFVPVTGSVCIVCHEFIKDEAEQKAHASLSKHMDNIKKFKSMTVD